MTLDMVKTGEIAVIKSVKMTEESTNLRNHLLDMGLIPKTKVRVERIAPMGDPFEIYLRGYRLMLRAEEAGLAEVDIPKGDSL